MPLTQKEINRNYYISNKLKVGDKVEKFNLDNPDYQRNYRIAHRKSTKQYKPRPRKKG
jgi:hypothetical protein